MSKSKAAKKPVLHNKWIRKGAKVKVIAGNEKGRTGTVLSRTLDRVVIQGLNIRKKHMKGQGANNPGRIMEIEAPIHLSNVQLCTEDDQAVKVKVKQNGDEKQLVYSHGGSETVLRNVKKS